jgi:hypothetical protein
VSQEKFPIAKITSNCFKRSRQQFAPNQFRLKLAKIKFEDHLLIQLAFTPPIS